MEEIGIILPEKVIVITNWLYLTTHSLFLTNIIIVLQDDQVTDAKGLPFAGPQSFDELESEDLYTKYKVTFHFNTIFWITTSCVMDLD